MDKYQIYLYLGIAFFVLHILMNGIGLDLSYFGIILICIGYFKPVLSLVIQNILWVLIALDIFANLRKIYNLLIMKPAKKKNPDDDE
jgi:hypothetical protein